MDKESQLTDYLPDLQSFTDEAWVEVIRKMDEAYADLVGYQVQIEEQNAALEEARSFFDSVQSAMSDLLIACDHEGRVQQVNRACEELTGRSAEDFIGAALISLCEGACQQRLQQALQQVRVEPVRDLEVELEGKEGPVPLALNCSARFSQRGRLVGIVVAGRPLGELQRAFKELHQAHAELKLAQERLVQAEKMASLGRLVAGVAHELNNPISFIYGNMHALRGYTRRLTRYFDAVHAGEDRQSLAALREELRLDKLIADLDSLVEGTLEGAGRVRDIVDDLRQFSSTQKTSKAAFDLLHVVCSALHWITKDSPGQLEVITHLPEHLEAYGHSGQIHQVIVNLLQNAVDAVHDQPHPRLVITAGQTVDKAWLTLEDNGPGVSDEDLSRLFDPFYTTKPVGQGTGLGLSISYGIVSEHQGSLTLKKIDPPAAETPPRGMLARLELPLPPDDEESPHG
ncbi:PAS domain-containing sensor histidine kinase [Marinospirillum perlucidum]|uniref:PAS domain-containing sensor histidine kinase n=1 Tax=Marinospirillum perlucidum TaxID=1982602 RepID=UPI000DF23707|nr:ATP-binding protein [Marinospirillum perlucidum]